MATLQEEGEAFQEAARDLAYELFKSLGMLRLIRRLGAQRGSVIALFALPVPLDDTTKRPAFKPGEYYEVTNGTVSRMVLGELLLDDAAVLGLAKYFLPDDGHAASSPR